MGMNMILTLIVGIIMTTMVATQVTPSIIEQIKTKKVQTQAINNQEVIFEAIKRYITLKPIDPNLEVLELSIQDLIDVEYIDPKVNDNGFGGTYEIEVNKALGVAKITTTIEDPKVQEAFLNSFMGTSKPTRVVDTTNKFETKFVLPNEVMHGNALLMTGIPIQDTPPNSDINKYWYDTSSGKATLKIYDGTNWVEVNLGGGEANEIIYEPGDYPIAWDYPVRNDRDVFQFHSIWGWTPFYECFLFKSGKVKLSFTIKVVTASKVDIRISKNNIPIVGHEYTLEGYSIDKTFVFYIDVNKGDVLQIYSLSDSTWSGLKFTSIKVSTSKETMFPAKSLLHIPAYNS